MTSITWIDPLNRFIAYLRASQELIHLTHFGAQLAGEDFEYLKSMESKEWLPGVPPATLKAVVESRAKFAKKESESDYPLVNSHSLMGAWAALECCIEDLFVAYLYEYPRAQESEAFRKISLPFLDYRTLSEIELLRRLLQEVQRSKSSSLRSGVNAFEQTLETIGISGEIHSEVKGQIYECQQVRNIIAHRGGVADERFCSACPQFAVSPGDTVKVSTHRLGTYHMALSAYGVTVLNRILSLHGMKNLLMEQNPDWPWPGVVSVNYPEPSRVGAEWMPRSAQRVD
jgi:hypothetical protein